MERSGGGSGALFGGRGRLGASDGVAGGVELRAPCASAPLSVMHAVGQSSQWKRCCWHCAVHGAVRTDAWVTRSTALRRVIEMGCVLLYAARPQSMIANIDMNRDVDAVRVIAICMQGYPEYASPKDAATEAEEHISGSQAVWMAEGMYLCNSVAYDVAELSQETVQNLAVCWVDGWLGDAAVRAQPGPRRSP